MVTNCSPVFCDYLTLTTPKDSLSSMIDSLLSFFKHFTVTQEGEYCYRSVSGGSLTYGTRQAVSWMSASGSFLSDLRLAGLLNDFLLSATNHPETGYIPHRLTRADLTLDESSYPPDKLDRAYSLGVSGQVSLTRKAVSSKAVKKIYSPVLYDDSGRDTGSVYFGNRATSKVRLLCYDKTQERFQKGLKIPPTTRYELTVTGDVGIGLKDVSCPSPCFYNYIPKNLLPVPSDNVWLPGGAGYVLERREQLPMVKLKNRMAQSSELKAQLVLVSQMGDPGLEHYISLIRKMYGDMQLTTGAHSLV
jgi:hypothetical protein